MHTWIMTTPARFSPSAECPTGSDAQDPRVAMRAAVVAARLGTVCRDWEAAEFDALVHRIARTQVRWADAEAGA